MIDKDLLKQSLTLNEVFKLKANSRIERHINYEL